MRLSAGYSVHPDTLPRWEEGRKVGLLGLHRAAQSAGSVRSESQLGIGLGPLLLGGDDKEAVSGWWWPGRVVPFFAGLDWAYEGTLRDAGWDVVEPWCRLRSWGCGVDLRNHACSQHSLGDDLGLDGHVVRIEDLESASINTQ